MEPAHACLRVFDRLEPIGADMLVVLADVPQWQPWVEALAGVNSAEERERAARQRRTDERDTRVLAYALRRMLLARVLNTVPAAVPLLHDALGRPWIAGNPAQVSLSHAGGRVAIAVDTAAPIGVDLEPLERAAAMPEIAHQVCHRRELDGLRNLPAKQAAAAMLAIWVRKEAFLKAEGVGLGRPMHDFIADDGARLASQSWPGTEHQVRMLDAGSGGVLAVAGAPGRGVRLLRLLPPGA